MRLFPARVSFGFVVVACILIGSASAASAAPVDAGSRAAAGQRAAPAAAAIGAAAATPRTIPAPAPGIGIGLDIDPNSVVADPRAKDYIIDRVAPGTTIQRRVKIQNTTAVVQSVRIYAGSSHIVDGNFIGDNDPSSNELTGWTAIASGQLQLQPGEIVTDLVTITVPQDAAEQEHYATIWAEIRSLPSGGSAVAQASRAGIRMYLSVGPGNGPPSDFSIGAISVERSTNGEPIVTSELTNTGGRALDISGSASLIDGPGGMSSGPFSTRSALTLAPGKSGLTTIAFPAQIVNGTWTATLTFTSGLITHAKTVQLTLAGIQITPATGWPPMTFWWLILVLLVITLLTAISVYYSRRKREIASASHRANGKAIPILQPAPTLALNTTEN